MADRISSQVVHEKISTGLAVVCSLIIPAVIILFVSLVLVPGPTVPKSVRRSLIWRRKLWEWHTGWLGLALSCALAFVTTNGMKNLFGKPRPDLLARCDPDIENVTKWVIGGGLPSLGQSFLVSAGICRQTDLSMLNDGFRSYPSGHSSFSAAGLVYLSLFLASKLALTVPSITLRSYGNDTNRLNSAFPSRSRMSQPQSYRTTDTQGGDNNAAAGTSQSGHDRAAVAARNQAAAPPLYLLLVAIIPFLASVYISSTRYSDFRHHGFDILFGWLMGTMYVQKVHHGSKIISFPPSNHRIIFNQTLTLPTPTDAPSSPSECTTSPSAAVPAGAGDHAAETAVSGPESAWAAT